MNSRLFNIVAAASSLTPLYLAERRRGVTAPRPCRFALRQTFDDLGGTFIGIGQAHGMRPDLFPDYLKQLRDLRERGRPFSAAEARAEFEGALRRALEQAGRDIVNLFHRREAVDNLSVPAV